MVTMMDCAGGGSDGGDWGAPIGTVMIAWSACIEMLRLLDRARRSAFTSESAESTPLSDVGRSPKLSTGSCDVGAGGSTTTVADMRIKRGGLF